MCTVPILIHNFFVPLLRRVVKEMPIKRNEEEDEEKKRTHEGRKFDNQVYSLYNNLLFRAHSYTYS